MIAPSETLGGDPAQPFTASEIKELRIGIEKCNTPEEALAYIARAVIRRVIVEPLVAKIAGDLGIKP